MPNNLISFRLDETHLALLAEHADEGTSLPLVARELIVRALNDQVLNDAVEKRLAALEEQQLRLRKDLRLTLLSIIGGAKRMPLKEAEIVVKRILGDPPC